MNFGSVFFRHTQSGWRVTYIRRCRPQPLLNGYAHRSLFENELVITGNIPADIKVGRFCKRPDRVIKVKEFSK